MEPHFDITENGKYKRLSNMTVNQYANYISPYVADQFRGPNNPNGLTLRDYNQLWDKKNGYIQASPSYKYINDFWRGTLWPKTLTREQKRTRYVMQKVTAQFDLPDNYVGIRKVDREYIHDFLNVDPGGTGKGFDPQSQNSVQRAVDAINNKISTGKLEVSDKAVTSVSLVENLNYFKMRAVQIEIQMPKGTKGLLTDNFMESEFIAKNNSTLEFIGAERYDYVDTKGRNMHGIKLFARMIQ